VHCFFAAIHRLFPSIFDAGIKMSIDFFPFADGKLFIKNVWMLFTLPFTHLIIACVLYITGIDILPFHRYSDFNFTSFLFFCIYCAMHYRQKEVLRMSLTGYYKER